MIKLFSLKQEKEKEQAAQSSSGQKVAPGLLRMQKGNARTHAPCLTSVAMRSCVHRRADHGAGLVAKESALRASRLPPQ